MFLANFAFDASQVYLPEFSGCYISRSLEISRLQFLESTGMGKKIKPLLPLQGKQHLQIQTAVPVGTLETDTRALRQLNNSKANFSLL
jgi:hypothetical protein